MSDDSVVTVGPVLITVIAFIGCFVILRYFVFSTRLSLFLSLVVLGLGWASLLVVERQVSEGQWTASKIDNAAETGNLEELRTLLSNGVPTDWGELAGDTPLHTAARYGKTESVDVLLDCGMNVDVVDSRGQSPLHAAVRAGNAEMVQFLLQRGANREVRDSQGRTAGDWASILHEKDIAKILEKATRAPDGAAGK